MSLDNNIIEDTKHWQNCKPPLSPNYEEVVIYKELTGESSSVCLLGMTKELIHLCDVAVDINPIEINKPTIKCNWNDLDLKFDVIIGDGVLNLEGLQIVDKMLKLSNKFISRVFMKKQIGMKYATFFPSTFPNSKLIIPTQQDICIVIWQK